MNQPSKYYPVLVAVFVGVFGACSAQASIIAGPSPINTFEGYNFSGIGFVANLNSDLTSFTFENQGAADTVDLVDSLGDVLDSVAIPSGTPSDVVGVNWFLAAGTQYYLLQTTPSNGLYTFWGQAAPADTEITMTDTGVFSTSLVSAAFSFGGGGPNSGTTYWSDFNNITTAQVSAPEPASFLLVLPFAAAMFLRKRQTR
jgi:hypothetical protein